MPAQVNNQRIAKNTLLLYGRMLLTLVVSLYTSRVVLNTLGVEDYGIYNVVGGIVTMFSFLNGAMVTSTQRYLTFELGKGNHEHLRTVFSTSIQIHAILALIIVILGESIGLWFFYHKMIIPESRMTAAMWVFQLSIVTMVIQVMSAPYNAVIIAHEEMNIFAVISIVEAVLKLAIVYVLLIGTIDKLILYAVLVAFVQLFIRFLYTKYCDKHYPETKLINGFDKGLVKEMGEFAGWNIWGNLAGTLFGTGLNLLLNMFFGPIVNAARAVAVQVESAIGMFSSNFLMAINPQITKQYAQDNMQEMHRLIFRASKFSFFLLVILSLPVFLETEPILTLWLKIVPDYTVPFLRILLGIVIIDATARPLMTAAASTGDVKRYQSTVGGILLSIVPIAYVVLKLGGDPVSVYIVHFSVCVIAFIARLLIVRPLIQLSLREYFFSVIAPCFVVVIVSVSLSLLVKAFLPNGLVFSLIVCFLSFFFASLATFYLGCTTGERAFLIAKTRGLITRVAHRD